MAEGVVALMEAVVEVAPLTVRERRGFAAGSVGLDVSTERVLHGSSPGRGVPPSCLRVSRMVAVV